jgi:site-specific recombinase XerD
MEEIEIISLKENKEKVSNLSIEELKAYKKDLQNMIKYVEKEEQKRIKDKSIADNIFKK